LYYGKIIDLKEIGCNYKNFIRYVALQSFTKSKDLVKISRNPKDYELVKKSKFVFFWLPDIRRFFNLERRAQKHRKRMEAVNFIKSCFKRTYLRTIKKKYFIESVHENELNLIMHSCTDIDFTYGSSVCLAHTLKGGSKKEKDLHIYQNAKNRMNKGAGIVC